MSRPSPANFPPPDIPAELRAKLPALLPFGDDKTGLLSRGVGPMSRFKQRISYAQAERLRAGVASELRPYIFEVPHEGYVLYDVRPPVPIATRYSEGLQVAVEHWQMARFKAG